MEQEQEQLDRLKEDGFEEIEYEYENGETVHILIKDEIVMWN